MSTLRIAGGRVLRPDMTVERADVLLDRDAGEILAVGETDPGEATLDADGGLVIPGLHNAHTHAAMTLFRGYADDKPLQRWLEEDIWPVEAAITPEDIRAGTELAVLEMIKSGTVAFADMYFAMDEVVDVVEAAGLRARLGYGLVTVDKDGADADDEIEHGIEFARANDGAADGRIRTAVMPHGLYTVEEPYLERARAGAREIGVPLHFHAAENEGELEDVEAIHGGRPVERADELGLLERGDFIAHGVHLTDAEIERLADRGAAVVHCPASNMKLNSGLAPVQAMLDAGVTVGLGTDGAGSNNDLDMFDEIRDAAMVGKLAADDAAAIPAATAVELATAGSAAAMGVDGGRIAPGANADLAVLDLDRPHLTPTHDPVSHLAYAAKGSDVRHTVCDGRVLMRDREVYTMDEAEVLDRARSRASALFERAGHGG